MESKICSKILTVGCQYNPPKGGIAQVIYSYDEYLFKPFKFIANSCEGSKVKKLLIMIWGVIKTFFILLLDWKIKIIHIHTASNISFRRSAIWVYLGRLFCKRIIMHVHGGGFKKYYNTNPHWIKSILSKCDCIIALSEEWKIFFEKEVGCRNVTIIENIVSKPEICKISKDDNKTHFLFFGLISEKKGIFDLVEVINNLPQTDKEKIILHIGGNGEIDKLNNYIHNYNLENTIFYEGFVSGKRKADLFNLANTFILPSYTEGLPITLLEAMTYSLPLISTNVGGIPGILKDKINGYIFEPGDTIHLATIIQNVINSKNDICLMGDKSKEMVYKFLPEQVDKNLNNLYLNLIH